MEFSFGTVALVFFVIATCLAISSLYQNAPFFSQLTRFFEVITFADLSIAVAKSVCFGAGVSAIACYHGLAVARSLTAVPIAAMAAVIRGLLFVFLVDVLFAYVRYLL